MTVTLGEVVARLDDAYPPRLAESWDAVGLVCGDPADEVSAALVCVDVTEAVVDEALASGAQLILAHHPLLLRGVESVAADTPKGRLIHRLIRGGCALFAAHTNADKVRGGVSDALADVLGLQATTPLQPEPAQPLDKWVVMVPEGNTEQVSEAMFDAGCGAIGDYRDCMWSVVGTGQFLPLDAANPAVGAIGDLTRVDEARVEVVAPRGRRTAVLEALRAAHPYEEPAFDVFAQVALDSDVGLGRIGRLAEPMSLREFVSDVGRVLPTAPWGVRAAGDPDAAVSTVAVCGGAGDSLIGAATAAGADVYLTADLRHHVVDEALRSGSPALIDAGHWATEFPWCVGAAELLADIGCAATVHQPPTDPFNLHCPTRTRDEETR
ncbi:Nif3-like dinuclear metal center hexameric protein [Gordonia iterans]|uniref:GTP cyclohydrolase 1 type 2 homolog n=1 Tax=Gordonia iterans TaxID=1004901 RepID=A0A2S0KHF4_9ACTN|nr:Nif3-like dinuclear metal center hexameric protein [Gordonia iterans]AVM01076.1 Nif3-like dinuclear metal center hexameric protein [Gordonia iterans]